MGRAFGRDIRCWIAAARLFREEPQRAAEIMGEVLNERGYRLTPSVVQKALGRFDVQVDMGPDLRAYTMAEAENLLKAGRIKTMPAWERTSRGDLLGLAMNG